MWQPDVGLGGHSNEKALNHALKYQNEFINGILNINDWKLTYLKTLNKINYKKFIDELCHLQGLQKTRWPAFAGRVLSNKTRLKEPTLKNPEKAGFFKKPNKK